MDYQIEEIDITNKLENLSLRLPEGLTFFPENFETASNQDEFVFSESMVNLKKVFKINNIGIEIFGYDTELYRSRKNADIYLPAIFFSISMLSENSAVVSIVLNVLSNYISDFLKGSFGNKNANIDFYIETRDKGKVKKLIYKGNVEGLDKIEGIINSLK